MTVRLEGVHAGRHRPRLVELPRRDERRLELGARDQRALRRVVSVIARVGGANGVVPFLVACEFLEAIPGEHFETVRHLVGNGAARVVGLEDDQVALREVVGGEGIVAGLRRIAVTCPAVNPFCSAIVETKTSGSREFAVSWLMSRYTPK